MEAATVVPPSISVVGPSANSHAKLVLAHRSNFLRFGASSRLPNGLVKVGQRRVASTNRRYTLVRASLSSDSSKSDDEIAPLQLNSPIGQFLSEILKSHPHLVPAAVEQQLEQLQTDRDAVKQEEEGSASGTDLVLYRRIAEVKANDRRKALEEILYALIVQKFMDANVSLVPTITPDSSGRVDRLSGQDEKLKQLHSPEAYEMIHNHLALILGNRLGGLSSIAEISKLRVGQVYAASIMYGYFLKRVDQRFQLEKAMKSLPLSTEDIEGGVQYAAGDGIGPTGNEKASQTAGSHPEVESWAGGVSPGGFGYGIKPSRLRSYVMSFDAETLQQYAAIRSKEAVSIIEKHTEALFGRPEIAITPEGTIDNSRDEQIKISFGALKRLVLEAVTFGSFLWEAESYVDLRYNFVSS